MLQEEDDEDKAFEDIDLDKIEETEYDVHNLLALLQNNRNDENTESDNNKNEEDDDLERDVRDVTYENGKVKKEVATEDQGKDEDPADDDYDED